MAVEAVPSPTIQSWLLCLIMDGLNSCAMSWMTVRREGGREEEASYDGSSPVSDPILLQTHMTVTCVQWNHNGTLLAFGGMQKVQDTKELCCIQFYTALGQVSVQSQVLQNRLHAHTFNWCRSCILCEYLGETCVQCRGRELA